MFIVKAAKVVASLAVLYVVGMIVLISIKEDNKPTPDQLRNRAAAAVARVVDTIELKINKDGLRGEVLQLAGYIRTDGSTHTISDNADGLNPVFVTIDTIPLPIKRKLVETCGRTRCRVVVRGTLEFGGGRLNVATLDFI